MAIISDQLSRIWNQFKDAVIQIVLRIPKAVRGTFADSSPAFMKLRSATARLKPLEVAWIH